MKPLPFNEFFQKATGAPAPYGYQCRLACGDAADPDRPEMLQAGTDCPSRLINIPTGLGKTAAVVLAWLWNRTQLRDPRWPCGLVCGQPISAVFNGETTI